MKRSLLIIFLILACDQALKIWIKTHMMLGEQKHIFGDWFIIHFTENNGMAFGLELQGSWGKFFLSLFRILAVFGIGYYLVRIIRKHAHPGLIVSISLVFAGALGNIIDSCFYGLLFSSSDGQVAGLLPHEGGYAGFLHGKVVDMFYFPIIEGHFPSWFPVWGSEEFIFFRPVFNLSDASISVGVLLLLIFQKRFWPSKRTEQPQVVSQGSPVLPEETKGPDPAPHTD